MAKIPYKINLSEDELPKYWQNIRPYMQEAQDPFINPVTFKPCSADDLRPVFCDELIEQELDNTNKFIEIPEAIRDFYKMYRPSPLTRAYNLEKALGTPAEIYYKFEGTNTSGSHKLNSAVAQVYYAQKPDPSDDGNRRRAMGHGPGYGLRLFRHRPFCVYGQGICGAEALP